MDEELGKVYGDTLLMLRNPQLFNQQFNQVIADDKFKGKEEVIGFLCMSDCNGKIPARVCKQICDIMEGYKDELLDMMQFCVENRRKLVWR